MKGYITDKTKLRRRVFEEVARLAYEGGGPEQLDDLPYKIISGENEPFRDSIFLERAIIGERLRVAMGCRSGKSTSMPTHQRAWMRA